MVCQCPGENYDLFVAGLFNECMYSAKEVVSFIFGWLSIVSWLLALLPQLRLNLLLRRSEALSPVFLLCWCTGDILNGVSTFVLDQLFTQKLLGVVWLTMDVFTISTHFYFLKTKKNYSSFDTKYRPLEIAIYIAVLIIVINNLVWAGEFNAKELLYNPGYFSACPESADIPVESARYWIGTVMAYATIPFYCFSRPGQIYKNWKRKTTEGLSPAMFVATFSGNFNQLISMLTMSQESDYLIKKIPYIIAALIPAACDVIVLTQVAMYSGACSKKGQLYEPLEVGDEIESLTI